MLLKKIVWYVIYFFKYLVVCGILTAIVVVFFPPAALIVGGLCLLGSFGAAKNDLNEKVLPKLEYKKLKKKYEKVENEFKGFDEMLTTVQRNL